MIQIRRSAERGYFNFGWLETFHTFSFGDYHDRNFMGFRSLRVINQDKVEMGQGFPTHSHRDMEIITYVTQGQLEHKDSMGNGSIIEVGDVQYMSAGSGVTHSEYNPSAKNLSALLQIWIIPSVRGATPRYAQKKFPANVKTDRLRLVVSPDGADDSIAIRQEASIHASIFSPGFSLTPPISADKHYWVQVVHGDLSLNGEALKAGDGAAISEENALELKAGGIGAEFLLFSMA